MCSHSLICLKNLTFPPLPPHNLWNFESILVVLLMDLPFWSFCERKAPEEALTCSTEKITGRSFNFYLLSVNIEYSYEYWIF